MQMNVHPISFRFSRGARFSRETSFIPAKGRMTFQTDPASRGNLQMFYSDLISIVINDDVKDKKTLH